MPEANWFLSRRAESPGGASVFCFPHAGGNPRAFLDWQPAMDSYAEIVAVCMPGRGHRIEEQAPFSVAELADGAAAAISAFAGRPIYLFGHSLGALVAFEVARRLRHLPALRHFVASGCSAPSLLPSQRVVQAARLEGRAFAEAVGFFGGLPPEIVACEALHDLLLPGLQADVRLAAGYRYQTAAPLAIGLSLINGRQDPHVGKASLQPWRRECRNSPAFHWTDGGHFYFEHRSSALIDVLRALVSEGSGAAARAGWHVDPV
jgi:surfactin synthase thioesterase subunit